MIPEEHRADADALPPALRAILDAELAAGNTIGEVGHSFPAPPIGAYFKMTRAVTTHPRRSRKGVRYRDFNSSIYAGEFTDESRRYFILEPALPPPPDVDMDAIRAKISPETAKRFESSPLVDRFEASLSIDYNKWKEGIGYDLEAIRTASPAERKRIEQKLIIHGIRGWREVEAFAVLNTREAREELRAAAKSPDHEIRLAVMRYAPSLLSKEQRIKSLVKAIESADIFGGLSQALDEVQEFHPPEVMDALFRGALRRPGGQAVHLAAMLYFLHGKAASAFDWAHRPFFLRFHAPEGPEREKVFRELCEHIGVDPVQYIRRPRD